MAPQPLSERTAIETRIRGEFNEMPGLCLTTDVIVGFPGETDSDFEELMEFLEEIPERLVTSVEGNRRASRGGTWSDYGRASSGGSYQSDSTGGTSAIERSRERRVEHALRPSGPTPSGNRLTTMMT